MSSSNIPVFFRSGNSDKNDLERKTRIYGFRLILALVITAIIVFLFPFSSIYQSFNLPPEGSIAKEDVIAPFTFPVLKNKAELETDRKMVLSNLPVILQFNSAEEESVTTELKNFFSRVESINRANPMPESRIKNLRLTFPQLEEEGISFLSYDQDLPAFSSNLLSILREFYRTGMVEKTDELPFGDNRKAVILNHNKETQIPADELLDIPKAKERLLSLALVKFEDNQLMVKAMYEIGNRFLVPDLTPDKDAMEAQKQKALDSITQHKGMVLKGEVILSKDQTSGSSPTQSYLSLR